ncbi:peroxidase [Aeromicrobium sp. A1-2]|uniref:Dyp-type peroxidase n=1 Tax=Aeromicrobium sp. A1-2 TaxID=2107713 RepID=UPI000E4FAE13|nr:Dyp-type peroxidase [Aeromicrobium sp. A1-2]AXT84411.1 peroxidase [Aeromicrobium sp. A1-2]
MSDGGGAPPPRLNRRQLLRTGAVAAGGVALGVAAREATVAEAASPAAPAIVPFRGVHQAGVATSPQAYAAFVAYDLRGGVDREALVRLMRIWTDDIERLSQGRPGLSDTEPELALAKARLTVTLGLGPGVFDAARLPDRKPSWLAPLPAFGIDRLEEQWSGGDLLLQVCADDELTVSHAVRVLTKEARTFTSVRWVQRGFRQSSPTAGAGGSTRNLMGQVDGTRNPDADTESSLFWIGDRSQQWFGPQPSWLTGGTSLVVRRIAMELDTWDELDRTGREQAVGRRLDNGAPLTGMREKDEPDLEALNDLGLEVIEPFAHIRRARSDDPRERFLRRPYNYDEAPPKGQLSSSGLVFATYQADVDKQYVPIQRRLDELDLLNKWTTPIGSAVFAVPPGCQRGEFLAQSLLG